MAIRYCKSLFVEIGTNDVHCFTDSAMLFRIIWTRGVSKSVHMSRRLLTSIRLFELLMALDALKLRNIIQLAGILSE